MYFPDNLNINDFDYILPNNKIALQPTEERNTSKLLISNAITGNIIHTNFNEIYDFLPQNSLLIVNSTKVIPARFAMQKATGGEIELLCVSPVLPSQDPQITINATKISVWKCIVGGRKIKPDILLTPIIKSHNNINFTAKIISRESNTAIVEFSWSPEDLTFYEILSSFGKIPLPPYIKRDTDDSDSERYQTVYADVAGSVAAPTAGLHFSNDIFDRLLLKNIHINNLILHIGPGTFVPIAGEINKHEMHYEQIFIERDFVKNMAIEYAKPQHFITATGTTSLRTLETLYWLGVKILNNMNDYKVLEQNFPYAIDAHNISASDAYAALYDKMEEDNINIMQCKTQLFIVPGYKIKTISALITNFHLPKSTLLLLVSAFIGTENCRNVYDIALKNGYRFLSYGDSSLLISPS